MSTLIEHGTLPQAYALYSAIPEFAPHATLSFDAFGRRLNEASAVVLIARENAEAVGFKVGYDRYRDGSFYSWMSGVVPAFRGQHIAELLLAQQEAAVREAGYRRIYVKTRNRFAAMRALLARSGYQIVAVDVADAASTADLRLTHVKAL